MAYKLLGKDFIPPDVHAKVTGKAKYADDFHVDGMVHAKLLLSAVPHGRVVDIDAHSPGRHFSATVTSMSGLRRWRI